MLFMVMMALTFISQQMLWPFCAVADLVYELWHQVGELLLAVWSSRPDHSFLYSDRLLCHCLHFMNFTLYQLLNIVLFWTLWIGAWQGNSRLFKMWVIRFRYFWGSRLGWWIDFKNWCTVYHFGWEGIGSSTVSSSSSRCLFAFLTY